MHRVARRGDHALRRRDGCERGRVSAVFWHGEPLDSRGSRGHPKIKNDFYNYGRLGVLAHQIGTCEECGTWFDKPKRGNQPYRFCSSHCSVTANNRARSKMSVQEQQQHRLDAVRRWEKRNPEKKKEGKRREYRRHKAAYKARSLAQTRAQRQLVIQTFGGKCVQCGFSDWRALQIDHINGNGRKERSQTPNLSTYYSKLWIHREYNKYQILCANC